MFHNWFRGPNNSSRQHHGAAVLAHEDASRGNGNQSAINSNWTPQSAPEQTQVMFRKVKEDAREMWNAAHEPESLQEHVPALMSTATDPLAGHPYYRPLQLLNRGASGFVQLAEDTRSGQRYAIKFIQRGEGFDVKTISRELMNQRMCYGHPNIVQLSEVFLTSHHLGIAMEFADSGDLSQYIDDQSQMGIDGLPEEDVRWLFQQLIVALDYCHRLGIANRDVKLDNMMLHGTWPSPVLKVCDFGFSKDEAGQSISKSTCGTPEYMAPEVLFEHHYDGKRSDLWSCGVSLYVMLTGVFPFARPADEEEASNVVRMQRQFTRIIQGDYAPLQNVTPECAHLVHQLLQPDPAKRATMQSVMQHPWFTTNLPPPLLTLNARIMAASAHNAGVAGGSQSATEVLTLVAGGRSNRFLRSASATPAEYQQQVADMAASSGLERANSQPLNSQPVLPQRRTPPRVRALQQTPPSPLSQPQGGQHHFHQRFPPQPLADTTGYETHFPQQQFEQQQLFAAQQAAFGEPRFGVVQPQHGTQEQLRQSHLGWRAHSQPSEQALGELDNMAYDELTDIAAAAAAGPAGGGPSRFQRMSL